MSDVARLPLYDIHTAAFLEFRGIGLTLVKQGTRVVFEAPSTEATYRALAEYQTNPIDIPLLDYISYLRRLRSRMLEMRDGSSNENGNVRRERETRNGNRKDF